MLPEYMVINKRKLIILSSLTLTVILAIVVFLTSGLSKRKQEIRKFASSPSGIVTAKIAPVSGNFFVGNNFTAEIRLNPGSTPATVSVIQIYLSYSYIGATPEIEIQDVDTTKAGVQVQPGTLPLDYSLLNSVVTDTTTKSVTIGLAGYTTSGYLINQEVVFGKINFIAKALNPSLTISFDPILSKIIQRSDNKDLLLPSFNQAVYSIVTDSMPPDTIISSPNENTIIRTKSASLSYTGTDNFTSSANLTYSWKLDGPTLADWSAFSSSTITNLANLANGSYTFQVKAKDEAGLIDATPAVKHFTIDSNTYLNFQIKLQGINSLPSTGIDKNISFKINNTTINSTVAIAANSLGIYSGRINLGGLTPGTYEILIKGPAHIQKKFANIILNPGDNTQDWSSAPILAGDLAGGGVNADLPDNMVDASDLGKLISLFNPLGTVPIGTLTDLNSDSRVDVSDLGLLISNFSPGVYGDR